MKPREERNGKGEGGALDLKSELTSEVDLVDIIATVHRYPSLSLHGIQGAFSDAGAKTVIPRKVFSCHYHGNKHLESRMQSTFSQNRPLKFNKDNYTGLGSMLIPMYVLGIGDWQVQYPDCPRPNP